MKNFCFLEFKDKPYREFLQHQRLSKKLQDFIIFSIALIDEDTKTYEGLKSTQKFLKSLGRYGNGAFLWTTYGTGEIPQAFSRYFSSFEFRSWFFYCSDSIYKLL